MRTLLALLAIVVLLIAVAMSLGWVSIDQTRPGVVQAPQFRAEGPKVSVGTENKTVAVPTLSVEKPGEPPANAQ